MVQWEYKSVKVAVQSWMGSDVNTVALDDEFNTLGERGWEMVAAVELSAQGGAARQIGAVFKRERSQPAA